MRTRASHRKSRDVRSGIRRAGQLLSASERQLLRERKWTIVLERVREYERTSGPLGLELFLKQLTDTNSPSEASEEVKANI